MKQSLLDEIFSNEHVVDNATGVLKHYYKLQQSGELTKPTANAHAMDNH